MDSSHGDPSDKAGRRRLIDQLIWLCPIFTLLSAAALLWLFGLGVWTALVAAVLIGCPIAVVWTLIAQRLGRPKAPGVEA